MLLAMLMRLVAPELDQPWALKRRAALDAPVLVNCQSGGHQRAERVPGAVEVPLRAAVLALKVAHGLLRKVQALCHAVQRLAVSLNSSVAREPKSIAANYPQLAVNSVSMLLCARGGQVGCLAVNSPFELVFQTKQGVHPTTRYRTQGNYISQCTKMHMTLALQAALFRCSAQATFL